MAEVWSLTGVTPTEKLVLLAFADAARPGSRLASPGLFDDQTGRPGLITRTGLSKPRVLAVTKQLCCEDREGGAVLRPFTRGQKHRRAVYEVLPQQAAAPQSPLGWEDADESTESPMSASGSGPASATDPSGSRYQDPESPSESYSRDPEGSQAASESRTQDPEVPPAEPSSSRTCSGSQWQDPEQSQGLAQGVSGSCPGRLRVLPPIPLTKVTTQTTTTTTARQPPLMAAVPTNGGGEEPQAPTPAQSPTAAVGRPQTASSSQPVDDNPVTPTRSDNDAPVVPAPRPERRFPADVEEVLAGLPAELQPRVLRERQAATDLLAELVYQHGWTPQQILAEVRGRLKPGPVHNPPRMIAYLLAPMRHRESPAVVTARQAAVAQAEAERRTAANAEAERRAAAQAAATAPFDEKLDAMTRTELDELARDLPQHGRVAYERAGLDSPMVRSLLRHALRDTQHARPAVAG